MLKETVKALMARDECSEVKDPASRKSGGRRYSTSGKRVSIGRVRRKPSICSRKKCPPWPATRVAGSGIMQKSAIPLLKVLGRAAAVTDRRPIEDMVCSAVALLVDAVVADLPNPEKSWDFYYGG